MSDTSIDARAVVAEIEAEVARRRAAGEYPAELLRQLETEFRPATHEPAEVLAVVGTPLRPISSVRFAGPAVVFMKRVIRRALAWYVQPIASEQTRFNLALLRELRGLEARVARTETPWGDDLWYGAANQ